MIVETNNTTSKTKRITLKITKTKTNYENAKM